MRVIQAAPGPLQGEAVHGTTTVTLTPLADGTTIKIVYIVGGYMRLKSAQIAPAVDRVIGAQLASLAARLGGNRAAPAPATP